MRKQHDPPTTYSPGDLVGIFLLVSFSEDYRLWDVECPRGHRQTRPTSSLSNIRAGRSRGRCDHCLIHTYKSKEARP